jgi:hypothetical protein
MASSDVHDSEGQLIRAAGNQPLLRVEWLRLEVSSHQPRLLLCLPGNLPRNSRSLHSPAYPLQDLHEVFLYLMMSIASKSWVTGSAIKSNGSGLSFSFSLSTRPSFWRVSSTWLM